MIVSHLYVLFFSSRLEKYLFTPSAHFLIGLFVSLKLSCVNVCEFWRLIPCYFICKYFLPLWSTSSHFVYGFLFRAKGLKFNWVPFIYFVFIFINFRGGSKKSCLDLCQRVFCLCLPLRILWYPALCLEFFWVYFCVWC